MTQPDDSQQVRHARTSGGAEIVPSVARELAELARELHAEHDPQMLLQHIVDAAVADVVGADHAGISLLLKREGQLQTPAASDALIERIDGIQYETRDGPCVQSSSRQQTVRSDDLRKETRWPAFAREAVLTGIHSMLSFELFTDDHELGALNLYGDQPNAFDSDAESIGVLFATHAAIAMSSLRTQGDLQVALTGRDLIGQAKGILMERYKITSHAAFELLVVASQRSHQKLRDLAEELATTGLLSID